MGHLTSAPSLPFPKSVFMHFKRTCTVLPTSQPCLRHLCSGTTDTWTSHALPHHNLPEASAARHFPSLGYKRTQISCPSAFTPPLLAPLSPCLLYLWAGCSMKSGSHTQTCSPVPWLKLCPTTLNTPKMRDTLVSVSSGCAGGRFPDNLLFGGLALFGHSFHPVMYPLFFCFCHECFHWSS